jgi:hypothetical protein
MLTINQSGPCHPKRATRPDGSREKAFKNSKGKR